MSRRKNLKAKYFEMIFGVLKLKFDEDKACSLSSQILTKSTKSAQKTSRKRLNFNSQTHAKYPIPIYPFAHLFKPRLFHELIHLGLAAAAHDPCSALPVTG